MRHGGGVPYVSTDHTPGGARMLIQGHEKGLLDPIEDAQKLSVAMGEFADDMHIAAKCGENVKSVVE